MLMAMKGPRGPTLPQELRTYMGVSKNRGTPKWMVKIVEHPIKMDDLGGKPTIFRTPPYTNHGY